MINLEYMRKKALGVIYNEYSPKPIEFMSAVAMTLWGLWLLLPWDTFSTPAYAFMSNIAPEAVWGLAMFFIGIVQFGYVIYGTLAHRRVSMKLASLVWIFIAVNFSIARIESTAVPIYTVFAIAAYWASTKLVILSTIAYGKRPR